MPTYAKIQSGKVTGLVVSPSQPVNNLDVSYLPFVEDALPAYNASTQKVISSGALIEATQVRHQWIVVALTQAEIDWIAEKTEREQIRTALAQLVTDYDAAGTFAALASPTTTQRNDEIKNAANRERRLNRATRALIKAFFA